VLEIGVFKAKLTLSALLDEVEAGARIAPMGTRWFTRLP
jgi:antitoxin (DNA-binding transcriptional repressor) of toxin-antitoxin stability system